MMIQIHQKSIPTAQLQHRLVQGESNIEKVVFFVPNVPNVDFSELIFTIKLLAEDTGKIVIGELDMDPTENGILLSWDVSKKYTRYGGGTRLQIDGADATGNIVYRALSEKFCMRKELTGEDAVQDPEPDPEAGYVPPIESGDNGKYLRAMNGEAIWDEVDHPKEILWVELKTDGSTSRGFDEIVEAVNKGHDVIVYRGIDQTVFRLVRIFDDSAEFETSLRETKNIYGKICSTINSRRVTVYADNTYQRYEWKVESPEKLPNPYALNFSGAVSGSYDGSAPMEIEIPIGDSGGGEKEIFWVELDDITKKASHNASEIKDAAAKGYCVIAREGTAAYYDIISVIGSDVGFRTFHTVVVTDANGEQHFKLRIILITVEQDGSYKKHVYLNTEPTLLPNPFPLKFSGAVSGSYDGSSEFNVNIPETSAESDWSVNDPNAPGYVKNRTHWVEETDEERGVIPSTVTVTMETMGLLWGSEIIEEGMLYRVVWNGVEYKVRASSVYDPNTTGVSNRVYCGNVGLLGYEAELSEVPFVIVNMDGITLAVDADMLSGESESATVSLFEIVENTKTIPANFIPRTIARVSDVVFVVTVTPDTVNQSSYKCDRDFLSISKAYIDGKNIVCVFVDEVLTLQKIDLEAGFALFANASFDGLSAESKLTMFNITIADGVGGASVFKMDYYPNHKELPNATEEDAGKILKVDDNGDWKAADAPATLPNPHAMTFSGAVEGTYDGSAPKEIHIPESKEYTLPAASETTLGGIKASAKTDDMTQPVGIGEDGFLFTAPGGSGGGSSGWELLTDITLSEESAIAPITYDAKYREMYAALTIPKVDATISTGNQFKLLHGYGLYYTNIGDTSYPYTYQLRCEKFGETLYELFCGRAQNGVGQQSQVYTRNSLATPKEPFTCGGTLVLPAETRLIVYGRE